MRAKRMVAVFFFALGLSLAAGCSYLGSDNPITRKLTWFSYLNGTDLREACGPNIVRYRFVYNAVYEEHVRTYDIAGNASLHEATLKARVIGPTNVSNIVINNAFDIFGPGRGVIREVPLTAADLDALDLALAKSGFFQPAPEGLSMQSDEFYWIGAVCLDGRFHFNAFKWPSPEFERLTFPKVLFKLDPTGIPVVKPHEVSHLAVYGEEQPRKVKPFTITIQDGGLVGESRGPDS